ncbi:MAG TPA: PHP domain-containing protein [Solirubrobacteraceae bacterium]|nr:PHP domain-containing protein [Solirubrobacteraceae bacterium]
MPGDAPRFDLQSHSRYSDGSLVPAAVVAAAAGAGVELLALTDHDTVDGVEEALEAGREYGLRVVPAVELSTVDGALEDLHLLGYGLDHRDPVLLERLTRWRGDRARRGLGMAAALREQGFELAQPVLDAQLAAGSSLGRPHLARAVLEHPANAARLKAEEITDPTALLVAYLLPGRPAYRGRTTPTVAEAIDAVHEAGGEAVWAHPFWDLSDPDAVQDRVRAFAAMGLDGVEAFYVTHDEEQTRMLDALCDELELLSTGSSDFHGPEHRLFSRFRAFSLFGCDPHLGPIAG